jgi:uncharacterized repeat protein (TIGR01451 family)
MPASRLSLSTRRCTPQIARNRRTFGRLRLLACTGALVLCGHSEARSQTTSILFVQSNWAAGATSTSAAVPYAAAQTAGNLNVVVVTWNDSTAQVQAVTDTTGNSYQRAIGPTTRSSSASQSIYYAINRTSVTGGANTVTVAFTAAAATPELRVAEYAGIDPLQPLDVTIGASANSASSSSGSVTTRNANDLLIGANWASSVTSGAGSGYTSRVITTAGDILEDRVVTAAGSYAATAPVSPSGPWIMQMAAFRAAGSPQPDLTLTKTHTGSFTQRQTGATYTLTVRNAGVWPTIGTVTVVDTLPAGLTATGLSGTGWTCTLSTVTCTRSSVLAAGSNYPAITLTVSVASNAPATVTNAAAVSGGGETNTANDGATDVTTIIPAIPDLTLTKTHTGSFTQGQTAATYTLTVRNGGNGPTNGVVTVQDTLPAGLTATALSGSGWTCTLATLTCTRSSVLTAGSTYSAITLTVTVANTAAASLTNIATVSGGGETNTANDSVSDATTITQVADLTLTKTHTGGFIRGQSGATYALTVTNSGNGPTTGTVTVSDAVPSGLTATAIAGTGWTCTQPAGPCTRSDVLAAGAAYPSITLTVNVASNAPASVINTAAVSGGGEVVTNNDSASDATTIATAAAPDLALAKTHAGTFAQGQLGAMYALTVSNVGSGPTGGLVTVTDSVPAGLIATSAGGAGWSCTQPAGPCSRSDVLAAGSAYPALTLTVNVAGNAPASVTNIASVSVANDAIAANNTASDVTAIAQGSDITVSAAHTGSFIEGQTGVAYSIVVSNVGTGVSTGQVTVADNLPAGLTATSLVGGGWTCSVAALTCSRTDVLGPGTAYPSITLLVDVARDAPPSVTNIVSVAGGGEFNTSNNSAQDVTAIVVVPDLILTSSHTGAFAQGQTGASYTLTVSNAGAATTSGVVSVTDIPPAGLTPTSLTGIGWTCDLATTTCTRADGLAPSAGYPQIVLVVDVALDAAPTVVNVAGVAGGGEFVTTNDTANDVTSVTPPSDLVVSSTHVGSFALGQLGATYSLMVTNSGPGYASGSVSVTDVLPPGLTASALTGTGWTCALDTLRCTRSGGLVAGAAYPPITLTVNVGQDAAATVTNTVAVSGGGETNLDNDSASDQTTIAPPPDLTIAKSHTGFFTQGQHGATYALTVTNGGGGPTVGLVNVIDTLPGGLTATGVTGAGWNCVLATVTCTRVDALPAGASYPVITVMVDVASGAPASLTNTAAVSGGGDANTANNTAADPTDVAQLPDLTVSSTHGGPLTQGQTGVVYTLTVTNVGAGPTSGVVTVTDTLPVALSVAAVSGTGWACTTAPVSCTRTDVLAAGASYPSVALTVDIAGNAPSSVTNVVSVSGGGEGTTSNDTASDVTAIAQLPDLALAATHDGFFVQGQTGAAYTLVVSNTGPGSTTGTVSVVDTLPPAGLTATALSGPGWSCTLGNLTCTRSDSLAPGVSYPAINLMVTVAADAPASVTNAAVVSGGGELNTMNDAASDVTTIVAPPDLGIAKAHTGSLTQGQKGATYRLTVTNTGGGPTAGLVSVTDVLPAGLTATAFAGVGWACALNTLTCTRSDALAAGTSYPVLTITVDVSSSAPASVTNTATVSGGGDTNAANNTASDPTTIGQLPDLTISVAHAGSFTQGQTGATYTIGVSNVGASTTSGTVTVSDALPSGLTATALSGSGWVCAMATLTCTRSDALAAAGIYPPIVLTVSVAANAPANVTNTASVSGGVDANTSNNTMSDVAAVVQLPDVAISITHAGTFMQGQTGATYTLTVTNVGAGPTAGAVTVTDMLPSGLTATALSGTGWSCTMSTLMCSRSDVLAPAGIYPPITLTVTVANNAPATVTNSASVSGGGQLNTANDSVNDVTTISPGASPPVFVTEAHFAVAQTSGPYRATLSLNASGTNTFLLAALHVELDGGDANWIATDNGARGTLLLKTDGYTGGTGNQRFQIFYWINPPAGTNNIVIQNSISGSNEITASAVLLQNVAQTGPVGATALSVSATGRTSESETVAATSGDLVLHVIADAVLIRGVLGSGETSVSIANDGFQRQNGGDGDASLWISTKPGNSPTTTVSSSGWPSGPAPSPRVLNGVGLVLHGAGPDVQAPTAPGSLVAIAPTAQINLSWTASTDNVGVTGYRVERCQGTGCASFSEIAAPTGTIYTDSAVAVGATYTYRVRANDAFGNLSPYSNMSSATVPLPDTQPPSAPGILTTTAANGTHVNLSWGAATDNVGVMDYRVERCDGVCTSSGFVKIGTVPATTFIDSGLSPNATYSYIVSAEDTSNNLGPYSNVSTVTTPATIPELVAAYSFDEGAGTTVADSSGNNRTGTIANATWTSTGKYGKALSFNGTSAKIRIPDDPGLHLSTAMTLEAWVNPSTVTSAWRDVIYKGDDSYFIMGTTSQSGRPSVGGTFAGTGFNNFGPSTLPVNTWSHLAATYDGTTLRLFVNGSQVATAPRTGAMTTSTNPLEIGGDSLYGQFFKGLIDEVRVYSVALTPTQIQTDMATGISTASPVDTLSPATLNFGSLATGTTSPAQSVTVTNSGSAALVISSISLTGTNGTDFAKSNTCVTTLAPAASCIVSVTLTPAATGVRMGILSVADNAAGSPHVVSLSGTGTGFSIAPRVSVLTPTLSQQFGVVGGTGGSLAWSVDGVVGGDGTKGTITTGGLYTPPATGGTHTVTVATDQLQTSSASVYVTTYTGTFTHHNDNLRTGQNLNETVLTPTNVNSATFGKLLSYSLDGLSIASPLYVAGVTIPGQGVHNVVYVATEHDSVYAFDADGISAAPLWQRSFLGPGVTTVPPDDTGECCDISPEIGITGTPVIDSSTGTLYVVGKTKEGASTYVQRLHALDLGTGVEKFGGPVVIQAAVPGNGNGSTGGQISFDPLLQNQRPSLLLNNGVVYIGFGSHGDHQPYHGWLLGYSASTLQQVMAFNVSPNADGGGIWQANGGPAADAAGNIYIVTGNGAFDADSGGQDFGDSFLKLAPNGTVTDYFTPWNQGAINANDFDLGAAGPLLLPDQPGPHPHLMVSAGKNNTIYLVDRDAMGRYSATTNDNQIVQSLINIFPFGTPEPGNYSASVYFNGTVYFGPIADNIQAFPVTNGLLRTTALTRSADVFKYPGATMAISAAGTNNGILWAIQRNGDCGVQPSCGTAAPGVLKAYDASNLATLLYSSDQMGSRDMFDFATKFSVPLVANGKVFVGSLGQLTVYGLLP